MNIEIGEKVYWKIGKNIATGIFKQINEIGLAEVVCISVGNKDAKINLTIEPSIFLDKTVVKQLQDG
jgi:hypothetical protein